MAAIDQIKERLDIVDVVSGHVTLAQAGRNLKARCPFHTERTPSFFVYPERQSWRCFGACAEGGDLFSFVMKAEGLTFAEALRELARRAGVSLPTRRSPEQVNPLHQANAAAGRFYQGVLHSPQGASARDYLEGRGLGPDTVRAFALGLSPDDGDALKIHLLGLGYTEELLLRAGLLHRAGDGATRDLFRGRLLFPIRDAEGHIVGFGGRALDDVPPKYLNTPQSPVFNKSHLLYGLSEAADAIRIQGRGVVVEGYTDALLAHQHGFRNVVASMGTALTRQQVALLQELAGSFVLALDPDAAGQEATQRSLEASWRAFHRPAASHRTSRGVEVYPRAAPDLRVALLPAGTDPAELIRTDPDRWTRIVEDAPLYLDFTFSWLSSRFDLSRPEERMRVAELLGPRVLALEEPGEQDRYLTRLEELVGVSRRDLGAVLGISRRDMLRSRRAAPAAARAPEGYVAPFIRARHDPLEEYTLALLLQDPSFREYGSGLAPAFFTRVENRELFTAWADCDTLDRLRDTLDEALLEQFDALLALPVPSTDRKQRHEALTQCLRRLEENALRELKLQEQVLLAEGEVEQGEALEVALQRNRRLREIHQEGSRQARDG